jgi:Domain of unknown function (DUF4194)
MSKQWETLAERSDGKYTIEDFEIAAYRLVAEQVLYHSDKHSRVAYWLIKDYFREFEQVLDPLGIDVEVNSLLGYVFAKPRHAKAGSATVNQTLLALVLRSIYDEAMQSGQVNDNSEVACDWIELEEKFRLATGRELPAKMELNALVRQFKRWGIARMADGQDIEDTDVEACLLIRPAIVEILGDTALQKLGRWAQSKQGAEDDDESETNETAGGVEA